MIELVLKIAAVALVGAAAYFYWSGDRDWTFACGVLAACSFFLSIKYRIKSRIAETDSKTAENDEDTSSD